MLNGQIALVTGASRGIGRAIALELGALGATVIGTATSPEGAAKISAFLSDAGRKGEGCVLEVRDATQVDALIRHIEKAHGAVTVLVNNAGITRDNLAMRLKDDDWDTVIDTDLKAVFGLSRAVIRGMMKAKQGRIINVTSVVGHAGNPGQANYCAAKAGVTGMSRALARELGSRNITVNCVAPGLIDTDMTKALDDKQRVVLLIKRVRIRATPVETLHYHPSAVQYTLERGRFNHPYTITDDCGNLITFQKLKFRSDLKKTAHFIPPHMIQAAYAHRNGVVTPDLGMTTIGHPMFNGLAHPHKSLAFLVIGHTMAMALKYTNPTTIFGRLIRNVDYSFRRLRHFKYHITRKITQGALATAHQIMLFPELEMPESFMDTPPALAQEKPPMTEHLPEDHRQTQSPVRKQPQDQPPRP